MSVLTNDRIRDLEINLQHLRNSIPETSGELRQELERQHEVVVDQIMRGLMNLMD